MAASLRWGWWRKEANFATVAVEAIDLQVLGGDVFFASEMNRHVGLTLNPGNVAALAVIQIGSNCWANANVNPSDLVAMRRQRQQSHDVDRHALDCLDDPSSTTVGAVFVD
jgi:hypothetical protein